MQCSARRWPRPAWGGRHLGRKALLWGVGLGTLPDLDLLANPWLDEIGKLQWHRGATHSLLFILLLAPALGWVIQRIHPVITWLRASWAVFLILATHVLIDVFTVYGTQVWWPFSKTRVGFGNLFIIDPLFTLPLLLAVLLAFWTKSSLLRLRACRTGLVVSAAVALWSIAAQNVVEDRLERALAARGIQVERLLVTPTPLNTLLWRGLIQTPEEILVVYHSLLERDHMPTVRLFPLARRQTFPEGTNGAREMEGLRWFADGFYTVEEHPDGLVFSDWRFGELRDFARPSDLAENRPQPIFSWKVRSDEADGMRIERRPPGFRRRDFLPVLWRRIFYVEAFQ